MSDAPAADVGSTYAIMGLDFEHAVREDVEVFQAGLYDKLTAEAATLYGTESKPIKARYVAEYLGLLDWVPPSIRIILQQISLLSGHEPPVPAPPTSRPGLFDDLDDDLPF